VLIGRGKIEIGKADLRWAVAFARGLWCSVFVQHGLVVDTRVVAPSNDPPRAAACLYFIVDGSMTTYGERSETFEAPQAIVVSDDQLDGSNGARPFAFTAVGDPYSVIELHMETSDLNVRPSASPPRLELDASVWDAARRVARLDEDDESFRPAVQALLQRLAEASVIAPLLSARMLEPTPKAFELLWRGLRPMVERLYLTPTLKEVGELTGISIRQIDRYVQDFASSFAFVGEGWRPATRFLRLKLAAIFLSAEGVQVADVARVVGYRSSDAMSRAFRDAKMAPPTEIQADLRALAAEERERRAGQRG
jgi:AraC-like DNA-binding protein